MLGLNKSACPRYRSLAGVFLFSLFAHAAFGQVFTVVHSFAATQGTPAAGLTAAPDGKVYGTTTWGGLYGRGSVFVLTPDGNGSYDYTEIYYAKPEDGVGGLLAPLLLASDGNFYGTAYQETSGTIFRIDASGQLTRLHVLSQGEGTYASSLIEGTDGYLYGTLLAGGAYGYGGVFRTDTSGNIAILQNFSGPNGASPTMAALVEGSDGAFYGLTNAGGAGELGTVFRYSFADGLTTLHSFTGPDGATPWGGLIQAADGMLYGTTYAGGAENAGTIFRIDTSGNLTTLHSFAASAAGTQSTLLQASDGRFYGTTVLTVFRMDSSGTFENLHTFSLDEGSGPQGALIEVNGRFLGTTSTGGAGSYGAAFSMDSSGNLTVLHAFGGSPDGAAPFAGLLAASDGYLYGSTNRGGDSGFGTLFRMDLSGTLTTLHTFTFDDGANPAGTLLQADDGRIYGTSTYGGPYYGGTIFRLEEDSSFTLLHSLGYDDGFYPTAGLIQASDGLFYGTTKYGGTGNQGTVFRMTDAGFVDVLHDFGWPDGVFPVGGVIEAANGSFYGTTSTGGADNLGTVFRLEPTRQLTTIHSFSGSDGKWPLAGFTEGPDGALYGTASDGGAPPDGYGFGVVFRIGDADEYSKNHVFVVPEGRGPSADLLRASDGMLYGTTYDGGTVGSGTIFRSEPNGNFAVLHYFANDEGYQSLSKLTEASDGKIYGALSIGGAYGGGIVFRIDPAAAISASSVTPGGGPAAGGTPFQISGGGFGDNATVWVGGVLAGNIFVENGTTISAVSPALPAGTAQDIVIGASAQTLTLRRAWVVDLLDMQSTDPFYEDVRRLLHDGVTAGCGGGNYCPDGSVTRAQMAALLLRARFGSGYVPPPATGYVFTDVSPGSFAADWIEDLWLRGISWGCGEGRFCPDAPVTRAQLAVFLLKALMGWSYQPPAPAGDVFDDVSADAFGAAWIEDLAARSISGGCSVSPPLFCPANAATRGQIAALLVHTFALP